MTRCSGPEIVVIFKPIKIVLVAARVRGLVGGRAASARRGGAGAYCGPRPRPWSQSPDDRGLAPTWPPDHLTSVTSCAQWSSRHLGEGGVLLQCCSAAPCSCSAQPVPGPPQLLSSLQHLIKKILKTLKFIKYLLNWKWNILYNIFSNLHITEQFSVKVEFPWKSINGWKW